jgi:glycosyltransferase involved in cell wall biosynthesis
MVGGTEIHTLSLASVLRDAGFQVTVCCYYERDPLMAHAFASAGIGVEWLALDRQGNGGLIKGNRTLWKSLAACLRRSRPDVVHVQYMTPGLVPVIAARMAGTRCVIATVHVTANHYGKHRWLPRRLAFPCCNAFLCVSKVAEKSFFDAPAELFNESAWLAGRRHFTIHNCVDLKTINQVLGEGPQRELSARLKLGEGPVIGIVARLTRFKGHDLLLESMRPILNRFANAKLVCVGGGDWQEHLETTAAKTGLSGRVIWTGPVSQADAFRYMTLMDVVAMPSRPGLEGFGLAAAEAMAIGKPLVASDVDGLAEVVGREGAGVLVPAENASALADGIISLLAEPQIRRAVGDAARERAQGMFSVDVFADRHLRLYRTLLETFPREMDMPELLVERCG